jgi:hypothetical protein
VSVSPSQPAVLIESELFKSQMEALGEGEDGEQEQQLIWRSLNRARHGLPTPGVSNPWGGEYRMWPCGPNKRYEVLLRAMTREEVEKETGSPGQGFYLIEIEPSPI